jgi:hypothetical protein
VKYWLTLLTLLGLMAGITLTLGMILMFGTPAWVAAPVTVVMVAGFMYLGTREKIAPPLVMKESVWLDEEEKEHGTHTQ